MSYEIHFDDGTDDGETFFLAAGGGLRALSRWVDTLPVEGFATLAMLLEEGHIKGTDALAEQLKTALADHPPDDPDVVLIATNLLGLIMTGSDDETATIIS